jgi:hypothetical protein
MPIPAILGGSETDCYTSLANRGGSTLQERVVVARETRGPIRAPGPAKPRGTHLRPEIQTGFTQTFSCDGGEWHGG